MAAFAMFSLKAPSLLAFDKERVEGNLHTIYEVKGGKVPTRDWLLNLQILTSGSFR